MPIFIPHRRNEYYQYKHSNEFFANLRFNDMTVSEVHTCYISVKQMSLFHVNENLINECVFFRESNYNDIY